MEGKEQTGRLQLLPHGILPCLQSSPNLPGPHKGQSCSLRVGSVGFCPSKKELVQGGGLHIWARIVYDLGDFSSECCPFALLESNSAHAAGASTSSFTFLHPGMELGLRGS